MLMNNSVVDKASSIMLEKARADFLTAWITVPVLIINETGFVWYSVVFTKAHAHKKREGENCPVPQQPFRGLLASRPKVQIYLPLVGTRK